MSLDQHTYVGPYAICRVPKYLGPSAPFQEWLESGRESLTVAQNNTGPLVEGATIYVPNIGGLGVGVVVGTFEPLEPTEIEPRETAVARFAEVFADELERMRADWRSVEVAHGVLSYVW